MNTTTVWKLVPAAPSQDWTNAFAARGPRIGTFGTTIRDVLATAPAPAFDLQEALQGVRAGLAFLPPGDAAIAGLDRIIAIFGAAPDGAEDATLARTGNTADHQAGWFAGIEQGQANARDAKRYRTWRDAMVAEDTEFRLTVAAALPSDVGDTRPPTGAEWDAAIDAAVAAQQGKGGDA